MAILLGRAPLPRPKDLPRALRSLASHPTVNLTQAGFDGSADRIVRLVRQALGAGTAASSSTGSALEIPAQGYRPHFEIDQDGVIKFAAPAALDREGNNVDRLRRMHPTLRELSPGLVEALGRGNAPHSYLHERSKTYNDMTDRALEEIDFALLYMEGLRLANAEKAVSGDGELPQLEAPVRERMDSLLQLHGTFILASRDGLEAYEAEQRYRRNQQQEADYRSAAVDFANSLQGRPEVVDPSVASAALNAAEEIGRGGNPERSGTVATGLLGNLTVTFAGENARQCWSGWMTARTTASVEWNSGLLRNLSGPQPDRPRVKQMRSFARSFRSDPREWTSFFAMSAPHALEGFLNCKKEWP